MQPGLKSLQILLFFPLLLAAKTGECPNLLDSIRGEFRQVNPRVQDIQILDSKPKLTQYWILGRGIVEGGDFKGDFEDELFGVFVVDDQYERVLTVIDVMPTPRWRDYDMWISDYDMTDVMIRGHGTTYGDQPLEKRYHVPDN